MQRTVQWGGDKGSVEWRKVKVVCSGRGLRKKCPFFPLLFNIYLMGMAEELKRAQLGVKLQGCWCGALMYANDVVLVADSGAELQAMLDVVEAYVSR